jgi:hypothetical protein
MSHPESRSRCGRAPKAPSAKATSRDPLLMEAVGAVGARLASPTFHVSHASCFSTRAGVRTAPAGAVRHPSVIDSEWIRVRCGTGLVDGVDRYRNGRCTQRTRMTRGRWPVIRGTDHWSSRLTQPATTWVTGPLDLVGRGMTDSACERRPHPGTNRETRRVEHVGRGGCESSACGADRIQGRVVRWEVAFAEGACGALPHGERDSGWDIVTGPTLFLVRRLTAPND